MVLVKRLRKNMNCVINKHITNITWKGKRNPSSVFLNLTDEHEIIKHINSLKPHIQVHMTALLMIM